MGMRLREEQIEEPTPDAACPFDELKVLRTEDHPAEDTEEITQSSNRLAIQGKFPFTSGPVHADFMFVPANDPATDQVSTLAMPDHLGTTHPTEGTEGGHEVDGLKDVGFALGVVSQKEVEAGREIHVQLGVIAEVAQAQLSQVHGAKMSRAAELRQPFPPIRPVPSRRVLCDPQAAFARL